MFIQPHVQGLYDDTHLNIVTDYRIKNNETKYTYLFNNPLYNLCANTVTSLVYNAEFISSIFVDGLSTDSKSPVGKYNGVTAANIESYNKYLL